MRKKVGQSCVECSDVPFWQKSSCPESRQTLSTAFISTVTKFVYIYCLMVGLKYYEMMTDTMYQHFFFFFYKCMLNISVCLELISFDNI